MTSSHTTYEDVAAGRRDSDDYRQGHAEAQRAYDWCGWAPCPYASW